MPTNGVAIIGLGFVGKAHLEALRRLAIPVRGILGSSPERTQEATRELKIERGYSSLEELCSDSSVDAVHVCSPNHVHYDEAKAAMEAGKHVMCEKPLAMDTRQSSSLIDLSRKLNRVGAVTYNLRYYPLCQEARDIIQKGLIGEPRLIQTSTDISMPAISRSPALSLPSRPARKRCACAKPSLGARRNESGSAYELDVAGSRVRFSLIAKSCPLHGGQRRNEEQN
jgi:predicted dehydrogenase